MMNREPLVTFYRMLYPKRVGWPGTNPYLALWRFSKRVSYFVGEGFRLQVSGFSKRKT